VEVYHEEGKAEGLDPAIPNLKKSVTQSENVVSWEANLSILERTNDPNPHPEKHNF
jgi:hypothetical protein